MKSVLQLPFLKSSTRSLLERTGDSTNAMPMKATEIEMEQPVVEEPLEIVPEKQPVSEEQVLVEEQPVHQRTEGGEDMRKKIPCTQGTRQGEKCLDILWVGNLDDISSGNIKEYYFKYIEEGYQTMWVRAAVDVPINFVTERVCAFFKGKMGKPEPYDALYPTNQPKSNLFLTFKGEVQTGLDLLSTYPENSLFLMSNGELPEQFKNHQGKLWQCTGKCGKAQNMRRNISKDKKCNHKILFDSDQPNGMGDNLKKGSHLPVSPASAPHQGGPATAIKTGIKKMFNM